MPPKWKENELNHYWNILRQQTCLDSFENCLWDEFSFSILFSFLVLVERSKHYFAMDIISFPMLYATHFLFLLETFMATHNVPFGNTWNCCAIKIVQDYKTAVEIYFPPSYNVYEFKLNPLARLQALWKALFNL